VIADVYDTEADVLAAIDRLHEEAEDLAATARVAQHEETRESLRAQAQKKVRQAARLREQIGGEA
jgi:hypothetical protein